MTARDTEVLRKLVEDKKFLKERSTQEKVAKDYGQTVLKEMYKPLLAGQESQLKETQRITQKQSEAARQKEIITQQKEAINQQQHQELINEIKRQPLIVPLIKSLNNYPNVVAVIMGEMSEYDLNGVEQGVLRELENIDDRILRTLIEYYVNKPDLLTEAIAEDSPENSDDDKYGEILYAHAQTATVKDIEEMSRTDMEALKKYLIEHPNIKLDGRVNPWKKFNNACRGFTSSIHSLRELDKKQSSGKGIKFLSSNPTELLNKLNLLIAEKDAGNTNVLSEASAIVDELRRSGMLTIPQIKKIYNFIR